MPDPTGSLKGLKMSALMLACAVAAVAPSRAAVVFDLNLDNSGADGVLDDGSRWNATPFSVTRGGVAYERSLAGGLRYSVEGGAFAVYRSMFTWAGRAPSGPAFQAAIERAFDAWATIDPVTGFGTQLAFVADLATPVSTAVDNFVRLGAEIDLLADNIGTGQRGVAFFSSVFKPGGVTLTSGRTGYGGYAIAGADVTMNTNVVWSSLADFEVILTHEIGHALGLGDVEDPFGNGFIDNNYSSSDPLGTLTDPWAHLVNPLDPGASTGLALYDVPNSTLGIDRAGVDILMESSIPSVFFSQGRAELRNDDYGGRQFLYPELRPVGGDPLGDYNGDGRVDAADYTVYRDTLGDTGSALPADGDRDRSVDAGDHAVWSSRYSPAAPTRGVPSPGAATIAGVAAATIAVGRRP